MSLVIQRPGYISLHSDDNNDSTFIPSQNSTVCSDDNTCTVTFQVKIMYDAKILSCLKLPAAVTCPSQ